jgi:hypothetical protein
MYVYPGWSTRPDDRRHYHEVHTNRLYLNVCCVFLTHRELGIRRA